MEDFETECSKKYGPVVHSGVDETSSEGDVYVKFNTAQGALKAYQGLQGRSFDGRRLVADYVVDAVYNAIFPKAATF